MTYVTDERLKSYLDTNQLHREQMCLAILALDKRFTDVRPRHPRGGPDGGRDIEALFRKEHLAYGAVGFVNQATDSDEKKRDVRKKFADDLESARSASPRPAVFVFMTNVNLTATEKTDLIKAARGAGFIECEVFDRERLRITLDSPDGLAARFQYLAIPLSEAEQASFFAKWGDDINSVIATGFQDIQRTLDHLLFLQEAHDPVAGFFLRFELDREYPADEIGHFRAFCSLWLKEPKLNIMDITFGSSDLQMRFRGENGRSSPDRKGIKFGIGGGQWVQRLPQQGSEEKRKDVDEERALKYSQVGSSSSVGQDPVRSIVISYSTSSFIRLEPVLALRDFDDCMFLPILNHSLAKRLNRIDIASNGYKLLEIERNDFNIDATSFEPNLPCIFDSEELADPWVRIRPKEASSFHLSFSDRVPVRMYASRQASSSLPPRHRNA